MKLKSYSRFSLKKLLCLLLGVVLLSAPVMAQSSEGISDTQRVIEDRRQICRNIVLFKDKKNKYGISEQWKCPEDHDKPDSEARYYYPQITSMGLIENVRTWKRSNSCTFAILQFMYEYAEKFRCTDPKIPLTDAKNEAYMSCMNYANSTFKTLLSLTAPGMDNTTFTLNVLATYIKYGKKINDFDQAKFKSPQTKLSLEKWIKSHYYSSSTGHTSNLVTIELSKDYLLDLTDLNDPDTTIKFKPRYSSFKDIVERARKGGASGEYASAPYGATNMIPFLILANVATNPSDKATFLESYLNALSLYSYTWMDGHIICLSARTYSVIDGQGTNHGLKSVLGFYFDRFTMPTKTSEVAITLADKNIIKPHPVMADLDNHGFEAAVYPITISLDRADLRNQYENSIDRGQSVAVGPDFLHGRMGKMHTDSQYWRYFLSDDYGIYTQNSNTTYRPGQTIPSGIMWRSNAGRSNFFMAIPDFWPEGMNYERDGFQLKYCQEWMQYGPVYALVTEFTGSRNDRFTEPFHYEIFGSMPHQQVVDHNVIDWKQVPTTPHTKIDTTYNFNPLTSKSGQTFYRLFYKISAEDPKDDDKASLFMAVTSAGKFTTNNDYRYNQTRNGQNGYWYTNFFSDLSFKIPLEGKVLRRSMGVVVETARPSDFPGKNDDERFEEFIKAINEKTDFSYYLRPWSSDDLTKRTKVWYTDLRGNQLVKEYLGEPTERKGEEKVIVKKTGKTVDLKNDWWSPYTFSTEEPFDPDP